MRKHTAAAEQSSSPSHGIKGSTKLSDILSIPEGLPFDPMHLIYLGAQKSFLSAIIKCKLVNLTTLSALIDNLKVPHYFRRRPRNVTEYQLWKAQEHRIFVLYFAPCIFLHLIEPSYEYSEAVFALYCFLSTAVYLMYKEEIVEQDLLDAEACIYAYQAGLIQLFGESVQTVTLHALQHLPNQVRKFGPLHGVSAMPFENLNRQLKRSITGTRGSAAQMVHRYLMSVSSPVSFCYEKSSCKPAILGKTPPFKRFKVGNLVFHTVAHGKTLKCSSYYAFLSRRHIFVKIKSIILSEDSFRITCRLFIAHSLSFVNIPSETNVREVLIRNSPFVRLFKSGIDTNISPAEFSHHAIIVKHAGVIHGVKIINSYEHE